MTPFLAAITLLSSLFFTPADAAQPPAPSTSINVGSPITPIYLAAGFLPGFIPQIAAVSKKSLVLTAYSSSIDETDASPFITAANTRVRDGVVASNDLPFGTRVRIPSLFGDKIFSVEDRMNARYYGYLDIWFPSKTAALDFGLRRAVVEILP